MRINIEGCTRTVILLKDKVIKFPRMGDPVSFELGVQANKREYETFQKFRDDDRICPILNDEDYPFIIVMPRARTDFTSEELESDLHYRYLEDKFRDNVLILNDENSIVRADGVRIPKGDIHPMRVAELVVYVGPDGLKIIKDRLQGYIGP